MHARQTPIGRAPCKWTVDVEHLEAEPIHLGSNRSFTSHETVARFYAKTAREEPLNGTRRLENYLASGQDVGGMLGRPKGSTKATYAAAEGRVRREAAIPPSAVPMPVSPSGVSGISAFRFRTCRRLD